MSPFPGEIAPLNVLPDGVRRRDPVRGLFRAGIDQSSRTEATPEASVTTTEIVLVDIPHSERPLIVVGEAITVPAVGG